MGSILPVLNGLNPAQNLDQKNGFPAAELDFLHPATAQNDAASIKLLLGTSRNSLSRELVKMPPPQSVGISAGSQPSVFSFQCVFASNLL